MRYSWNFMFRDGETVADQLQNIKWTRQNPHILHISIWSPLLFLTGAWYVLKAISNSQRGSTRQTLNHSALNDTDRVEENSIVVQTANGFPKPDVAKHTVLALNCRIDESLSTVSIESHEFLSLAFTLLLSPRSGENFIPIFMDGVDWGPSKWHYFVSKKLSGFCLF